MVIIDTDCLQVIPLRVEVPKFVEFALVDRFKAKFGRYAGDLASLTRVFNPVVYPSDHLGRVRIWTSILSID